jgi:hypothetical protein
MVANLSQAASDKMGPAMRRVALSFVISLAVVCLLIVGAKASLFVEVLLWPGLKLSSYLVPKNAWASAFSDLSRPSPWLYFYVVFGVLIDGLMFTWPVLLGLRIFNRRFSK